jgi:hypothetical protein
MSMGGSSVPNPPPISAEEKQILQTANDLLKQQGIQLSESDIQNKEIYNLVKDLSGLYTSVDVPASTKAGNLSYTPDAGAMKSFTDTVRWNPGGGSQTIAEKKRGDLLTSLVAKDPSLKGLTLQQVYDKVVADPAYAFKLGYATQTGNPEEIVPGRKEMQLNPEAVNSLKGRLQSAQADQERISSLERANYEEALKGGGVISEAQRTAYLNAINGEGPVSEGSRIRTEKDFAVLKENLARMGSQVVGDTPTTAVSNSTAGVANVGEFARTTKAAQDAERLNYIGLLNGSVVPNAGPNVNGMPSQALQLLTSAGGYAPGVNAGGYGNMAQGYMGLMQPYANQRSAQYGADMQGAMNKAGNMSGLFNLAANAGSAYLFGPWGPLAMNTYKQLQPKPAGQ